MASLAVVTNTSTSIAVKTSDYASGVGDFYVFYSAAFTASHTNRLGEAGLGQWYHGAAGFLATGSASDNADATQAGAGWDNTNGDGGLCSLEIEQAVACTGTGAAFALADANNTCMQQVHLQGPTASYVAAKFWTIWANGAHAVAVRLRQGKTADNIFPNTSVRTAYVANTRIPSSSGTAWGFSGTHLGVMTASGPGWTATAANTAAYTGSDNNGITGINGNNSNSISPLAILPFRLVVSGYDNAVTTASVTAFANDYSTHSGTNKTLTVTTGTKTTSGTDLYGNASTTWTDGFDPQRGAYIIAASSNHVNLGGGTAATWGIDGTTVTKRYRPCYILTGWTGASIAVTLGGAAQAKGTDYESYVDTTNHIAYLCLLKDIAGSEGALDASVPAAYLTRRGVSLRVGSRASRPPV